MRFLTRSSLSAFMMTLIASQSAFAQAPNSQAPKAEETPYYHQVASLNGLSSVLHPRFSRDAKFVALEATTAGQSGYHIFVMPSTGGTPVQVTTGDHDDQQPAWFPGGDRIAFYSDRLNAVMTVAINPKTGAAVGALKRVTVEKSQVWIDVSPDGKSIVYAIQSGKYPALRTTIRAVPSSGGAARTVSTFDGSVQFLRYDRDGRFIYFTHFRALPVPPNEPTISRVPSTGGPVQPGGKFGSGTGGLIADPVANRVLKRACDAVFNCNVGNVYTLTGDSLATFAWAQRVGVARMFAFAPDGSALFTTTDNSTTAIHAVPLNGGPVRALTDGSKTDAPYEWRGDRILYKSETVTPGLMYVSQDGKQRGFIEINPTGIKPKPDAATEFFDSSPDGKHFIITVDTGRFNLRGVRKALHLYDAESRTTREITRNFVKFPYSVPGSSFDGTGVIGREWVYFVLNGSVLEMRALSVTGESRLLRTLPGIGLPNLQMAVGAERFAHVMSAGDSASIMLTVGAGSPRRVLTVKGSQINEMSFSPDSRVLFAAIATDTGSVTQWRAVFLSIGADGSVTQAPRWHVFRGDWSDPRWMPDGEAVIVQRVNDTYTSGSLWRIPARSGAPVQIMHRERAFFENIKVSPDGREIAVDAAQNQTSTLWRIDLKQAAAVGAKPAKQ